ncbi:MAG: hypothetical protein Q9159_001922 [Coniocarpon cinnabarinum]
MKKIYEFKKSQGFFSDNDIETYTVYHHGTDRPDRTEPTEKINETNQCLQAMGLPRPVGPKYNAGDAWWRAIFLGRGSVYMVGDGTNRPKLFLEEHEIKGEPGHSSAPSKGWDQDYPWQWGKQDDPGEATNPHVNPWRILCVNKPNSQGSLSFMASKPPIEPSAIDQLIYSHLDSASALFPHPPHLQALALQVQHNLQYQHDWSGLRLHTHSALGTCPPLARPLVSGVPPNPIYIHPDKQIEFIKAGIEEKDAPKRREWVLPTHLSEKWSLKKFGEVFDAIETVPEPEGGNSDAPQQAAADMDQRELKRVLLATVDEDSTVTYYIVHDGIVKPRQN